MEYIEGTDTKVRTVRDLIMALEKHEARYGPDARVLLLGLVRKGLGEKGIGEVDASKTVAVRLNDDDDTCAILVH